MQRAHAPTPPPSAGSEGPTSAEESPAAAQSLDLADEARSVAAAIRSQLRWSEEGGVQGLPRPRKRAARPAAPPPAPPRAAEPTPRAAAPSVAEHVVLSAVPQAAAPSGPAGALAAASEAAASSAASASRPLTRPSARSPVVVEAEYPELPGPEALRGADGLSTVRRVLGDCRRCKLCFGRNNIVFADGAADAWLAFVGEGPGADEDRLGKPFVGAAGQLLDRMIEAMAAEARKRGLEEMASHLSRQAVYICNVVKCRPPGNRTPELDEISSCAPFLRSQLYSLRPTLRVIVALGRTPTQYLLRTTTAISSLRGNFAEWEGIPVMPTYHPAYLLRTPSAKRQVWEDLQKVIDALASPQSMK